MVVSKRRLEGNERILEKYFRYIPTEINPFKSNYHSNSSTQTVSNEDVISKTVSVQTIQDINQNGKCFN